MSDTNKAHFMRIYGVVFDEGRLEVVDEVIAADAVDHSPPPSYAGDVREDLKSFTSLMRSAFPDARFTVHQMVAEGDLVAAHCTMGGAHEGESWASRPPVRKVSIELMDSIRVVDGRCTEHWGVGDLAGLMQQIGPPPSA